MSNKKSTAFRSAKTGRFVTEKYAKKHPKTTVREKLAKPAKSEKKKLAKPCGHDFYKKNKKKCGLCGKRRASSMPFPAKPGC